MRKKRAIGLGMALMTTVVESASAATITVGALTDYYLPDGNCELREAVVAAQTNAVVDGCVAGEDTATDVIDMTALSGVITLYGNSLNMYEDTIILGPGAESLTLVAGTIEPALRTDGENTWVHGVTVTGAQNGAFVVGSGALSISNCEIAQNSNAVISGGAVAVTGQGKVYIDNSTLRENSAYHGGAIGMDLDNPNAQVTVRNSRLLSNSATVGGAIFAAGQLVITDSEISGNTAEQTGAVMWSDGANALMITRTVISSNSDSVGQGALFAYGRWTLSNVTISGNSGWGIDTTGVPGLINSSTITMNGIGGIIGTGVVLNNSIVAGNNVTQDSQGADCMFEQVSAGYNIDGDSSCGLLMPSDQPATDPLLGQLVASCDNNRTYLHLPQSGSPAVDRGDPTSCPDTDQRGMSRPQDGDEDGVSVCDIGAVEVQGALAQTEVTETSSGGGGGAISLWSAMTLGLMVLMRTALTGRRRIDGRAL